MRDLWLAVCSPRQCSYDSESSPPTRHDTGPSKGKWAAGTHDYFHQISTLVARRLFIIVRTHDYILCLAVTRNGWKGWKERRGEMLLKAVTLYQTDTVEGTRKVLLQTSAYKLDWRMVEWRIEWTDRD